MSDHTPQYFKNLCLQNANGMYISEVKHDVLLGRPATSFTRLFRF